MHAIALVSDAFGPVLCMLRSAERWTKEKGRERWKWNVGWAEDGDDANRSWQKPRELSRTKSEQNWFNLIIYT